MPDGKVTDPTQPSQIDKPAPQPLPISGSADDKSSHTGAVPDPQAPSPDQSKSR